MSKQGNDDDAADEDDDNNNNHCKTWGSHSDVAEDSDPAIEGATDLCNIRSYLPIATA